MEDMRRNVRCTRTVECRVLTDCGCVGSDGQVVMEDVRRNVRCTRTVECT